MTAAVKALDPAFQGVGQKAGLEIWRIENFQPVPFPKSDYGKFYMGDSYIVLNTSHSKSGSYMYDIHFWIGKDTCQDEAGTAAIKTVELDAALGGCAVQHRELQGHETDKFLSYFKPCIVPLEGGVASGFKKPEEEVFETRLYACKGKRVVKLKQVPFARPSLNHDDVFILDTEKKIYQFNGANSNIQERAKALEVVQFLKEKYHDGVCTVAIVGTDDAFTVLIDDDVFPSFLLPLQSDSGEFWVLFGGFAPLGKKVSHEDDIIPETTPAKLYSITIDKATPIDGELKRSLLENNKCFILDCGSEVFVWVGRVTQVEERKAANQVAEGFVASHNRPKATRITRLIQGYETNSFKSHFESWPAPSTAPSGEDGKGKVSALLKQQKVAVKAVVAKTAPVIEEVPLLEGGGKMGVWRINDGAKTLLAKEYTGKFYSGDCYIVLYTYHSRERKEDFFLCWWIGKDSVEDDRKTAAELANSTFNSLKGSLFRCFLQGRIFEGKEPPQFIALFQPMVVLKGGLSAGYKKSIEGKGLSDETYTEDSVALFHIAGISVQDSKALQVNAAATSLNSTECFLLQSGSSTIFTWYGTQSSKEHQELAANVADSLKPGVTRKHCKGGAEVSAFWSAFGKLEVEEVYNFSQDDLLTEDILKIPCRNRAVSLEGLSPKVALFKVEGNEPCFFTVFFSWDSHRAILLANSFQKKVALLFGTTTHAKDKSGDGSQGPRQRAEALAALTTAFNPSSETKTSSPKPASTAEAKGQLDPSEIPDSQEIAVAETGENNGEDSEQNASEDVGDKCTYSYDQLKSKSENPVTRIDFKRREVRPTIDVLKFTGSNRIGVLTLLYMTCQAYLSAEEFETVFGMTKEAFSKMPKWKQDSKKKEVDLF
ncbi:Villin-3 [Hibiscus syriacus]|uniref:Villin-3 n=1 Tax=Hibiscus syriacus TaxID=106335 RepID=A0A6A2YZB3_HIBSY|nr:Villin-3 [Hibiscus syriacus]